MKNLIKYLFFLGVFVVASCAKDDIETKRLSPDHFFVTFETQNGNFKSLTVNENKTVTVGVTIAATKGAAVTVVVEIVPPEEVLFPQSAEYKVLDMEDPANVLIDNTQEIGSITLTFPEGTGSQSFKFVPVDNTIKDGNRTFTARIRSNSANYKIGVDGSEEGATMPILVKDND